MAEDKSPCDNTSGPLATELCINYTVQYTQNEQKQLFTYRRDEQRGRPRSLSLNNSMNAFQMINKGD